MSDRYKKAAAYLIGLLLLASVVAATVELVRRPRTQLNRVAVGGKDEIYFSHSATREEAEALGQALRKAGFLNDRGTTVLLSKGTAGTLVSFVLSEGGWDHPATVYSFEEIGRRIAHSIGGFPIKVRLIDLHRIVHRELTIGRLTIGTRDEVYYYGSATEAEARQVANALRAAGFLQDQGAAVVLSRDPGIGISFVVADDVWNRPDAVAAFERLVRTVAPTVGGLPIELRLLNEAMVPEETVLVTQVDRR